MIAAVAGMVLAAGCAEQGERPEEGETGAPADTAEAGEELERQPITAEHPYETIPVIDAYYEGEKPWGGGPFHYQIDILDSVPGESVYSPLRNPQLVAWKEGATPRILRSVAELEKAERNGELTIEATGAIVNAPVVKWPGDYLGGDARLQASGGRTI